VAGKDSMPEPDTFGGLYIRGACYPFLYAEILL
jgi:hypothetical protein